MFRMISGFFFEVVFLLFYMIIFMFTLFFYRVGLGNGLGVFVIGFSEVGRMGF